MKSKNLIFFAAMLFLVVALKYAFGQDEDFGEFTPSYEDPLDSTFGLMTAAPILGAVFGAMRVLFQRSARPVLQPISLK